MDYQKYAAKAADDLNSIIYISDMETYEIKYLNKAARNAFNCPNDNQWQNKKCYELLQGKTSPCEFCTNHIINENDFYTWEIHNEILNNYYSLKDIIIDVEGKKLRMEIATDITELRLKINHEKALNACIETLHTDDSPHDSIGKLLKILATHYGAERGYVFTINSDKSTMSNTHEWCKEGIEPQIHNLKNVPLEHASDWFEAFDKVGEFSIADLEKDVDKNSEQYKTLEPQGITSLVVIPLRHKNNSFMGFIGLDNSARKEISTELIKTVAKFVEDFFDKTQLIEQLNNLSYIDSLTGIANRHSYNKKLEHYEVFPPKTLGVIYVNINGLKHVNESKGYKYGDNLIITLANILTTLFGENVFKIDGDEFIVLQEDFTQALFDTAVQELRNKASGVEDLIVSIGSLWNGKVLSVAEQVEQADGLMYMEKQYYTSNKINQNYRTLLVTNIISEIEKGMFQVYLQPQLDLKTMQIASAEALVRKTNESGKIESPFFFIPFYEKENIIQYLDKHVFSQVCILLSSWKETPFYKNFTIAVNLSRITLQQENIVSDFLNICHESGITPDKIVIEITESIQLLDINFLTTITTEFSKAGFVLSLDDFGSGYSNLSLFIDTEFDEVKIDKSLIDSITTSERTRALVSYSIDVCNSLHVKTSVAEGIETQEQCDLLKKMNFGKGQGYLFDKPLPISDFEQKYIIT